MNSSLKQLESERSRKEFCWTMTPFSIQHVFSRSAEIQILTYLDADLWFVTDPTKLLDELNNEHRGAFITAHGFSPSHANLAKFGRFNVQFLSIHRDRGHTILSDWAKDCADWCYARLEDGKFGDQKYLDTWSLRYEGRVKIGSPENQFQGPWNAGHFQPSDALTYHFSSLRLVGKNYIRLADVGYEIPRNYIAEIYLPYLNDLEVAEAKLCSLREPSDSKKVTQLLLETMLENFRAIRERLSAGLAGEGATLSRYLVKRNFLTNQN